MRPPLDNSVSLSQFTHASFAPDYGSLDYFKEAKAEGKGDAHSYSVRFNVPYAPAWCIVVFLEYTCTSLTEWKLYGSNFSGELHRMANQICRHSWRTRRLVVSYICRLLVLFIYAWRKCNLSALLPSFLLTRQFETTPSLPLPQNRPIIPTLHPLFSSNQRSGLDNAGKTTILKAINGEDITKIAPTLGFNIKTLHYKGFKLNVWDVGGQKTIRSYWRNYFEKTDGLIWVVDSADKRRLADCKRELYDLLSQEKLSGASLLVFANKQDLAGALPASEISKLLGLEDGVAFEKRHWKIEPCSAVNGGGLLAGMDFLVADIASRVFTME